MILLKVFWQYKEGGNILSKIFTPHELKTIEVDVEKKIFRVNGEDFGENCTDFSIYCTAGEKDFLNIRMEIGTSIQYSSYNESGEKTSDRTIERNGQKDIS